jgi:hypothetical protein
VLLVPALFADRRCSIISSAAFYNALVGRAAVEIFHFCGVNFSYIFGGEVLGVVFLMVEMFMMCRKLSRLEFFEI